MTAFRATYSDWKLIKTRGVVQVVMEVPLADADAAYDVLGGMPVHGKERWFGIAALKSPAEEARAAPRQTVPQSSRPDGAKRPWRDLDPTTQAGMHCNDPVFGAFLREKYADGWREAAGFLSDGKVTTESDRRAECVRLICGVTSRKELSTNHKARVIWHQIDTQFQAWRALERVGA
jgi:hypothetical protein